MNSFFNKNIRIINRYKIYRIFIFFPILIYLGKRSLIAYDEGIYALQAKWILLNSDWVAPLWWGNISLDRTIGIQALIAFSQKIFGPSNFSIYIPNILASFLMLFFTYELHKEIFGNKYSLASPIILSTTFLWFNYSHLATQDMIFSALVTSALYASIKFLKNKKNIFSLICGLWIGLAFMMKTYLTLIPLLAIIPLFIYGRIFFKKHFWIGLIVGFIPFSIWSYQIISNYDFLTYSGLYSKLIALSEKNNFTNPIYYYFWNFPLNIFPWSLFAILGLINAFKSKNFIQKYTLFFYPVIVILLLSLFSTKTPYYPLQILSLISLNSFRGLFNTFDNKNKFNRVITYLKFYFFPTVLLTLLLFININENKISINSNDKLVITLGLLLFSLGWLSTGLFKSNRSKIVFALAGPYLMTSIFVQSGKLSDRTKDLRLAAESLIEREALAGNKIEIVKKDINSTVAHSKIIKISLLMPSIGNGIKDIKDLKPNQYAWVTNLNIKLENNNKVTTIDDSKIFSPWKLVLIEN